MSVDILDEIKRLQTQEDEACKRKEMLYEQLVTELARLEQEQQLQKRRYAELESKYEAALAEKSDLRMRCRKAESEARRQRESNDKVRQAITQMKVQYESLKRCFLNMMNQDEDTDVVLYPGLDRTVYEKKVKSLEEKIDKLQEKLGEETVSLSVIAEGLKGYAEEAGIGPAHDLFNHLNTLLISIPAWTKNVPQLKRFFCDFNKKNGIVLMTGDFSNYIEFK